MRIEINEDLRFKMSEIAIEVMEDHKKTNAWVNNLTLEGIARMLELLKPEASKNPNIKLFINDVSAEILLIVKRMLNHTKRDSDAYEVECAMKNLMALIADGYLNEIYYFGGKRIIKRVYDKKYGTYITN